VIRIGPTGWKYKDWEGVFYPQRMLIENGLADAVDFFHLDALSSAVRLKIDL
jgi:uncharacterized protein YecE (DUF72 family)